MQRIYYCIDSGEQTYTEGENPAITGTSEHSVVPLTTEQVQVSVMKIYNILNRLNSMGNIR